MRFHGFAAVSLGAVASVPMAAPAAQLHRHADLGFNFSNSTRYFSLLF
jgi:hypothetical protein